MTITAQTLNDLLSTGGQVLISTRLNATLYKQKHAGMFSQGKDGNLYVARGRQKDCLSFGGGEHIMVTIQTAQPR